MLRFFPNTTARKAFKASNAYCLAFKAYYAANLQKNASILIKSRVEAVCEAGLPFAGVINIEIALLFSVTTNSAPSSFWFLCYILSSSSHLSSIRTEISTIVTRKTMKCSDTCGLGTTAFHRGCPLMIVTWEEVLRHVNASSSVRTVGKDTTLANQCHSYISGNIGLGRHDFQSRRFLKSPEPKLDIAARERRKLQENAYFPFGGGKHLCPGPHFAFTEIMSLVVTLVYGFEITMADERGSFEMLA